jgi:hypothetical protein
LATVTSPSLRAAGVGVSLTVMNTPGSCTICAKGDTPGADQSLVVVVTVWSSPRSPGRPGKAPVIQLYFNNSTKYQVGPDQRPTNLDIETVIISAAAGEAMDVTLLVDIPCPDTGDQLSVEATGDVLRSRARDTTGISVQ